jgi:hypothetical protein
MATVVLGKSLARALNLVAHMAGKSGIDISTLLCEPCDGEPIIISSGAQKSDFMKTYVNYCQCS